MKQTRRLILKTLLAVTPATLCSNLARAGSGQTSAIAPTPACPDGSPPTPLQTQGPYYRPDSPHRDDLTADAGRRQLFSLEGFVSDTHCRAVPGAQIEMWHADERGEYDNRGVQWRAYQFADASGRWRFDTILTEHIRSARPTTTFGFEPPKATG